MTCDTAPGASAWRIDELAQRSGVSVDTIRFYQRQRLLEPPRRVGRTALYGPEHLARLEQVRDLQSRHLSLAAIRTLLGSDRAALADALFAATSEKHRRDELPAAAGVPEDLLVELEEAGLLAPPASLGRDRYDEADVRVLQALRRLLDLGIPRPVVVRLSGIYASSFARMQSEVIALITGADEQAAIDDPVGLQELMAQQVSAVLGPMEVVLDYCHQRSVQRLTLDRLVDSGQSAGRASSEMRRDANSHRPSTATNTSS